MRTPQVIYDLDDVVSNFIAEVTGGTSQDLMIGAEICMAVGLASRQFRLRKGQVIIAVQATADLRSRLPMLTKTDHEVPSS